MVGAGASCIVTVARHELAIGEGEIRLRHGDGDFRRGLLVRRVEAGKPVACVFVLALRPDLYWFVRIGRVRRDEIEAQARFGNAVVDLHGGLSIAVQRFRERHTQPLAVIVIW